MPQYQVYPAHVSIDMRERAAPPIPESNVSSSSISIIIPEDSLRGLTECVRQQSWLRRQAGNTGAIASRNAVSVVIPTVLREFIRRFVFSRIAEGGASMVFGAAAGYLPCILQTGGLYRDIQNHTHTRWTIAGRMACIILPGAGVTALLALGAMTPAAAAAALGAANFVYTPLRDFFQNYVRRDSNLTPDEYECKISAAISAIAYFPNQIAVNQSMQYGADLLTPYLGSIGANAVARAGVNFFGECLDDTASLASTAYLTGQQVRTHTYFSPPSEHAWNEVTDRILNIHAGRSSLFSSTFSAAFLANLPTDDHTSPTMASTVKPGKTMGRESLATLPYNHLGLLKESISVGIAAVVGYFPFILTSYQTAPRNQMDMEADLGQQELSRNAIEMARFRRINE